MNWKLKSHDQAIETSQIGVPFLLRPLSEFGFSRWSSTERRPPTTSNSLNRVRNTAWKLQLAQRGPANLSYSLAQAILRTHRHGMMLAMLRGLIACSFK
jgi:hypothetical protein